MEPSQPPMLSKEGGETTILRGSSRTIWRGKKSQNKNFDDHISIILLALMLKLTVATMEMFLLLENSRTLCELKSGGAS